MIVHDMRTPLAAILALSELAQLELADPAQMQEDLETIYSHALRLNVFVNDMLMLAKMRAGELVLNRSMVDIEVLVDLVKQSHLVMARLKRIDIAVHWPVLDACEVFIDEALFQRVLDNLLSNALKFSPSGSEVIVQVSVISEVSTSESHLKLSVIDSGPGISKEYRETIFDQYAIIDVKQKDIAQIGLGLAFCKMVVEAHGGRIFTESNKPHGAIFTIEL
jgi:signal transduction histidine kinase